MGLKIGLKTHGNVPQTLSAWLINVFGVIGDMTLHTIGGVLTLGILLTMSKIGRYILSLGLAIAIYQTF